MMRFEYPLKRAEPPVFNAEKRWFGLGFKNELTRNQENEYLKSTTKATTNERVELTKKILKTLEGAFKKKITISGVKEESLSEILAFSDIPLPNLKTIDFMVGYDEKAIGLIRYRLPYWSSGEEWGEPAILREGKIELEIPDSYIKTAEQYNALQTGLGKVQTK